MAVGAATVAVGAGVGVGIGLGVTAGVEVGGISTLIASAKLLNFADRTEATLLPMSTVVGTGVHPVPPGS